MATRMPPGALLALPGTDSLAEAFARLPRESLISIADAAIEEMDRRDPDADLEPDGDELDGSGAEDDFVDHSANWLGHPGCPVSDPGGADGVYTPRPIYGVDQSAGPINLQAAHRAHIIAERGLVRSPTGGWRHP